MTLGLRELFVGASTFGIALLYFYALALSIITMISGILSAYIVIAAWAVVTGALYFACTHNHRQRRAADQA